MTVIKTTALALMALLISATVVAGHHEKGEGPMLAAKPGQIMIVYYWPCVSPAHPPLLRPRAVVAADLLQGQRAHD